jgi:hypothetical protein
VNGNILPGCTEGHSLSVIKRTPLTCHHTLRHCQTNLTGRAKGADLKRSGCKLTPLNQGGRAVLFEDSAGVEMAVVVEVVVD